MKQTVFKKMIKEAVKEAIQEELKDVLLEAVRSPKQQIVESIPPPTPKVIEGPSMSSKPLQLRGSMDTTSEGASLPDGNVSMDQIMNLMNK